MRFDPERYRGAIVDLVAALVHRSAPRPDRTGSDGAAHA
jgi:hypothetical protein